MVNQNETYKTVKTNQQKLRTHGTKRTTTNSQTFTETKLSTQSKKPANKRDKRLKNRYILQANTLTKNAGRPGLFFMLCANKNQKTKKTNF